jgi:hypothetical protein
MQDPLGKKHRYNFLPKKSLEEVVDVLKERVSPTPAIEPTQGLIDEPNVNTNPKKKKQDNCWHQAEVERRMIMEKKTCKNISNSWRKNNTCACKKSCTRRVTNGGITSRTCGRKT